MTVWMLALAMAGMGSDAAARPDTLEGEGRWYTEHQKSIVEIYDCGDGTPCGRVAWIDPDKDNVFTDDHNHDPALRGRPMEGVVILSGFVWTEDGWRGGEIYNPKNGKSYAAKMNVAEDGSLLVKGCVGPICKGLRWTEAP
ncbi:MAG: DUF2147 domain-containing protein [Pseudomonadota bacterium]